MDKSAMMPQPMNPMQALPFVERGKLVTGEYTDTTVGFATLFDGTGYVSDVNFLPGVTVEMLHWYFTWRGLNPENYKATNPDKHIAAMTMQTAKSLDEDLTDFEKYWDTTQTVVTLGEMGPTTKYENFKCPSDVGFPFDFESEESPKLICIRGYHDGEPPMAEPDYFTVHQLVEAEGGVEVRTKIWIGWTVRYGQSYKALPDGFFMPPMLGMGPLMANKGDMALLATVLPSLYAENH